MLGTLVRVISSGKPALDAVMLEMGRKGVLLIEREEITGPDCYPTDPARQKWAHEESSLYLGDHTHGHGEAPPAAARGAERGDPPVLAARQLFQPSYALVMRHSYEQIAHK